MSSVASTLGPTGEVNGVKKIFAIWRAKYERNRPAALARKIKLEHVLEKLASSLPIFVAAMRSTPRPAIELSFR